MSGFATCATSKPRSGDGEQPLPFLLGFLFVRHDHPFFAYLIWWMVIFFSWSKVLTWLYLHSLSRKKKRLFSYTCQVSTFLVIVRPSSLFALISTKSKTTNLSWCKNPPAKSRSSATCLTDRLVCLAQVEWHRWQMDFFSSWNPSVAVFVIFWWSCRSYYRDHHFKSESPVEC